MKRVVPTRSAQLRPSGVTYTTLHDVLKAEGFVLYAGQGELSKALFRISTMGNLILADSDRMLNCSAAGLSSTY
jgi:aspartate aminotransferase-like enzyme